MLNLQDVVQRELHPNERLVWSGVPGRGLRLRPNDAVMIPFSLMWGGFAIFWECGVLFGFDSQDDKSPSGTPLFMKLWGIPFVLLGLYLIVGRFFADAFQRARTVYAVTDRRVLILSEVFDKRVRSLSLQTLPEMTLAEKPDGSGTITFGASAYATGPFASGRNRRRESPPAFEFVKGVRYVHDLILETQHEISAR